MTGRQEFLIDLSFEFGKLPNELAAEMPEADLHMMHLYSQRRLLPQRRLEIMLARLCMYMDAYMGGAKNVKVSDYLLDYVEEEEMSGEEVAEYFGFNPINKRGGDGE